MRESVGPDRGRALLALENAVAKEETRRSRTEQELLALVREEDLGAARMRGALERIPRRKQRGGRCIEEGAERRLWRDARDNSEAIRCINILMQFCSEDDLDEASSLAMDFRAHFFQEAKWGCCSWSCGCESLG